MFYNSLSLFKTYFYLKRPCRYTTIPLGPATGPETILKIDELLLAYTDQGMTLETLLESLTLDKSKPLDVTLDYTCDDTNIKIRIIDTVLFD